MLPEKFAKAYSGEASDGHMNGVHAKLQSLVTKATGTAGESDTIPPHRLLLVLFQLLVHMQRWEFNPTLWRKCHRPRPHRVRLRRIQGMLFSLQEVIIFRILLVLATYHPRPPRRRHLTK
mmetsp:Transcript_22008/g.52070  ORF Transcript_22008/g.52070 Transcript_22008/m.52070 type:complete len:120 (+) Transcript_22008:1674-2033(+)